MSTINRGRPPRQERSRESFERMIEATIGLCRERPYNEITLAEICARAGVSTGALYGRVASKHELLRVVQVEFLARLDEQFTEEAERIARRAKGLDEVVPAVVGGLGRLLEKEAPVLRSFMLRSSVDPVIAEVGSRAAQQNHAKFVRLVQACEAEILNPDASRAIEASMLLIYASQARFLGLDSVGGLGEGRSWDVLLKDLGDMMLAYLRFRPALNTSRIGQC